MYKVQVTPIIGLPQFDGWAHVATTNQGTVVWALAISGNHAGNVGRDLVDFLETQTAQSPQEIYRLVQRIIQDTREKLCELSCTVVVFGDATSMFCAYRGQIWLRRGGKLGKLLVADSDLGVVEGKLADNDVYIIATQQATRFLGEVEQKIIQGYDTDTIVTSITPGMRLEENTAQSALAFISPIIGQVASKQVASKIVSPDSTPAPSPTMAKTENLGMLPAAMVGQTQEQLAPEDNSFSAQPNEPLSVISSALHSPQFNEAAEMSERDFSVTHISVDSAPISDKMSLDSAPAPVDSSLTPAEGAPTPDEEKLLIVEWFAQFKAKSKASLGQFFRAIAHSILSIDFRSLFSKIWSLILKVINLMRTKAPLLSQFHPFSQEVYIERSSPRKMVRWLLGLGIIALLLGGGIWWWRRDQSLQMAQAQEKLTPISESINQARSLSAGDPVKARELTQDGLNKLEELKVIFAKKPLALKLVEQELTTATGFMSEISGKEEVAALPIFFDTRAQQSDFVITHSGIFNDTAILFDNEKKQLLLANLATKEIKTVVPSELPTITALATKPVDQTVWFLGDGVRHFKPEIQKTIKQDLKEGDVTKQAKFLSVFGEAIYLVNGEKRAIYKIPSTDGAFGEAVRWLKGGQSIPFEDITSFVVDGDIWLATRVGEILRFRSGNKQNFSVTGMNEPFNSALQLFATDELENLYVLEPARQRLVVLNKKGEFLREFKSSSLAAATSLFVNEKIKQAFAVNGSIVFSIAL